MENQTEQTKKVFITDEMRNSKWDSMLKVFKGIIEDNPSPKSVKEKLLSLAESAKNTQILTPRQSEGIYARCHNYINGEYGNTKTEQNVSQEHNFSTK